MGIAAVHVGRLVITSVPRGPKEGSIMSYRKGIGVVLGVITSAVTVGALTMPAYASLDTHNSQNSGGYCGASSKGCSNSTSSTICASAGAFGAFGPGVNFGNAISGHIDEPGGSNSTSPNAATEGNGADGQLTGSNNGSIC